MREYKNLEFQQIEDIGFVRINRPEVLNALNKEVFSELKLIFDDIALNNEVKVVILTGKGDKAFAAGSDIKELQQCTFLEARQFALNTKVAQQTIANFLKPVIAALNGFTLGGGLEVAMCCDIRIASDKAKIGQPEIGLGFIPGGGGTQRLARLVGVPKAKELVFTGKRITAQEAFDIGLVNIVVPHEELVEEAFKMAKEISAKSSIILEFAKIAIDKGVDMDLDTGLQMEIELWAQCFATEDRDEGINAFIEKRTANFKGK